MDSRTEIEFLNLLNENALIVRRVCCMYCSSEESRKDLEQEICLQLWRSYSNFKGESKISTWLYRVALNTAITFYKKTKKQPEVGYACKEFDRLSSDSHDDPVREQLGEMYKAIEKLSKIEKALVMLYIDDKGYDEIAETLGITQGNARIRLMRIKDKLKTAVNN